MNLTKEQLERLVALLDKRYAELVSQAQEHLGQLRDEDFPAVGGAVGDPADQATADLVRDTEHAAVDRDVREIRDIEAARERIESGEYGNCVDCGVDIGFDRLQVNPAAVRCVPCQDLYERTHAQQPGEPSL